MGGPLLILGAVVVGAILLNRSGLATKLGPTVPGAGGDPERRTKADVRDGWSPRVLEVARAATFAMLGCGRLFYAAAPIGGRITNAPLGLWYAPGFYGAGLDFRDCRPPAGSSATGGGRRRSWWGPVDAGLSGSADVEYLEGGKWTGPKGTEQVMGVTIGAEVYVRSDQTRNFASLTVRGGTLWVGNSGWLAVDEKGRDLDRPVILYKGQVVPAASWPGEVAPWSLVARGSRRTAMLSKGQAHDAGGHVAPFDMVGPIYVWALLQRPRVLVSEVQS